MAPPPYNGPSTIDSCVAAIHARLYTVETGGGSGGDVFAFANHQVMVGGNPDRKTWRVHCWGELDIKGPYSYRCSTDYRLQVFGGPPDQYLDATASIAGGKDIHFKMNGLDPEHLDSHPLDWEGLLTTQFGLLLGHGVKGDFYAGTNCPDFSFASGKIFDDDGIPHVRR